MYRSKGLTEADILKALDYLVYLDVRLDKLEEACDEITRQLNSWEW